MSNTYIISDLHFGHFNIIKYCNRPFKTIEEMNSTLVKNYNSVVNKEDTVYFLGDLCFKSQNKNWEKQLNGKMIHIKGNHDRGNSMITKAVIEHNGLNILLQHRPPEHEAEIPDFIDIVLCGHVHNQWLFNMLGDVPILNCSVEMWGYKPISLDKAVKEVQKRLEIVEDI